jgi:hypothetical protein
MKSIRPLTSRPHTTLYVVDHKHIGHYSESSKHIQRESCTDSRCESVHHTPSLIWAVEMVIYVRVMRGSRLQIHIPTLLVVRVFESHVRPPLETQIVGLELVHSPGLMRL